MPQREPTSRGPALIVAAVMMLANVAGFVVILWSPWDRPTASLWAMMCLAMGALVGFLFGVPSVNPGETQSGTHSPNSNIMVVSDWLTKMIVGIGLVELRNIWAFLREVSAELGESITPDQCTHAAGAAPFFALALIVYFFIAGIIQGYLLTRLYIARKFEELEAGAPSLSLEKGGGRTSAPTVSE